ncbi:hypothetical protein J2X35_002586 [Mesorhizobium sp. BE184]|nr:hypothetical protein [Mesorhizobium sp. BE184]
MFFLLHEECGLIASVKIPVFCHPKIPPCQFVRFFCYAIPR